MFFFKKLFWLNLITLWTFFKTKLLFNACFKLLVFIMCSVLSCKLAARFSNFPILILSGKNGKSLWSSCNFSRYWTPTSRTYHSSLSSWWFFYEIFIKLRSIFDPLKGIYWKLLWHCFCHINYLHPNTEDVTILYFFHSLSCICCQLLHINRVSYSSSNSFFYH